MSYAEGDEVGAKTSVSYVCNDCGRVHNRNSPPCNDCGSMNLSATEGANDPAREIDERESWQIVRDGNRGITGLEVFATLIGSVTLLAGASLLVLTGMLYENLSVGGVDRRIQPSPRGQPGDPGHSPATREAIRGLPLFPSSSRSVRRTRRRRVRDRNNPVNGHSADGTGERM